jgi:hypothetical protein
LIGRAGHIYISLLQKIFYLYNSLFIYYDNERDSLLSNTFMHHWKKIKTSVKKQRGYVEYFILAIALLGFMMSSGLTNINKFALPPITPTPTPIPVPPAPVVPPVIGGGTPPAPTAVPPAPAACKPAAPCTGTDSCGASYPISGTIVDQTGKPVQGITVVIFNHNRENANYTVNSFPVETGADGKFNESGSLVCDGAVPGNTGNFGDSYSVRPNCSTLGRTCTFTPATIENQQVKKAGVPDCAANGTCNFTVTVQ